MAPPKSWFRPSITSVRFSADGSTFLPLGSPTTEVEADDAVNVGRAGTVLVVAAGVVFAAAALVWAFANTVAAESAAAIRIVVFMALGATLVVVFPGVKRRVRGN